MALDGIQGIYFLVPNSVEHGIKPEVLISTEGISLYTPCVNLFVARETPMKSLSCLRHSVGMVTNFSGVCTTIYAVC